MNSIWNETVNRPSFHSLEGDRKTDVLIIGAGITGILCAYFLQQAGVDYLLVEQDIIVNGVTSGTTAKITAQHGLIFDKLIKEYGTEKARLYYEANEDARRMYEKMCACIDCDYERKDSFVYSRTRSDVLEKELRAMEQIGCPGTMANAVPLPFETAGAVCLPGQAQFHPLQFLCEIAKELWIYEHTKVLEMRPREVVTSKGTITADAVIETTHFPINNKHGAYFLKLYQSRSYVLALENAQNVSGMYVDAQKNGLSFRNYGPYLLLGGGGHRTGKKGGKWAELSAFAKEYYPDAKECYRWATQDTMSLDGIPYIGPYGKSIDGYYVAAGYNKWGMTSSMVAAKLLTDQILGKENAYAKVFCPSRSMIHPQLFVNACEATKNLLTPTTKRCPHLGCALTWNKEEHSWDCACHGSRFDEHGEVLDNPATGDAKKLDR